MDLGRPVRFSRPARFAVQVVSAELDARVAIVGVRHENVARVLRREEEAGTEGGREDIADTSTNFARILVTAKGPQEKNSYDRRR